MQRCVGLLGFVSVELSSFSGEGVELSLHWFAWLLDPVLKLIGPAVKRCNTGNKKAPGWGHGSVPFVPFALEPMAQVMPPLVKSEIALGYFGCFSLDIESLEEINHLLTAELDGRRLLIRELGCHVSRHDEVS